METPALPAHVDPLGEALHFLRMTGTLYCRSEFTAPWSLQLPVLQGFLMFHVVTDGECWLEIDQEAPRHLGRGALALVPHGLGHRISSALGVPAAQLFDLKREQVSERYEILRHGGGGAAARLICGAVCFDHPAAADLIRLLPRVIVVDAWGAPEMEWVQTTLRFMAVEARELHAGGETVITRLADILVIQAIRAWVHNDPAAQGGWLGALKDPHIGQAIRFIHRDPARAWTVEGLASAVGMSRSAFAARFTALVGEPVMRYLARWRMNIAFSSLRRGDTTVGEIAKQIGYESEAAFSRAFKRSTGMWPSDARRHHAE
jgi:AraC-like DNA-binding protein